MAGTCCLNASICRYARTSSLERKQVYTHLVDDRILLKGRYKPGLRVAAVAGVDFGTTHSTISVVLQHTVKAVPVAENGSVLLPSTVFYSSESGTCWRGSAAKHVARKAVAK